MKDVTIEFSNIQSHEHTQFVLQPGLNFILADDNNVGKSTIFKVLNLMVRVPNVNYRELSEILRTGSDIGYASFRFEGGHVIFWLVRDDAEKVRSFFETRADDGGTYRTAQCPQGLLQALDIIVGDDGLPINFNDADSVQLIVQDTPKNDAVLARVLIDERVENVRNNARELDRVILQDHKITQTRYNDTQRMLSTLTFNDAVDEFNGELNSLLALTRVTDQLIQDCKFSDYPQETLDKHEEVMLQSIVEVLRGVENIESCAGEVPSTEEVDKLLSCLQVLGALQQADFSCFQRVGVTGVVLDKMEHALGVLQQLQQIEIAARSAHNAQRQLEKTEAEILNITADFNREVPTVVCPVKGKVYYTDEECVPCVD